MGESLEGRSGIVTGASSGIGRATAEALAAEGVSLTIAARGAEELEAVAERLRADHGVDVHPIPTDVRDPSAVAGLVEAAIDRHDGLDLAINNAGTSVDGDISEIEPETFRRVVETNVDGAFYVTREALPALRDSGGNLVFVGSFAGHFPFPPNPVYAGTKAWVRHFAHSLEGRVGDDGVAVSVINPGGVRTPFEFAEGVTQEDRYAAGEAPEPEEIAECVVFACRRTGAVTVHELNVHRRGRLADFY